MGAKQQHHLVAYFAMSIPRYICFIDFQDSIPNDIEEGQHLEAGTFVGLAGNSGTTFTPHCHLVFGFFDQNDRYWSTPIEWEGFERRKLLPFPTGYEYSDPKYFDFGYPKLGQCVKIV